MSTVQFQFRNEKFFILLIERDEKRPFPEGIQVISFYSPLRNEKNILGHRQGILDY